MRAGTWLRFYATKFDITEINTTFYQLPEAAAFINWRARVPPSFIFCLKMFREITHVKRLEQPETTLPPFFRHLGILDGMLGPILIQLPPSLTFQNHTAQHFFHTLKAQFGQYEFALEARHTSWFEPLALDLLKQYDVGCVIADSGHRWPESDYISTKKNYCRLHGPDGSYSTAYDNAFLEAYGRRLKDYQAADTYVFFNNDGHAHAIENARLLKTILGQSVTIPTSQLQLF
jgi:uncharacterized protein YecE (DUF72 family)